MRGILSLIVAMSVAACGSGTATDVRSTTDSGVLADAGPPVPCDPFAPTSPCPSEQFCGVVAEYDDGGQLATTGFECLQYPAARGLGDYCQRRVLSTSPQRNSITCGSRLACVDPRCVPLCTASHPACSAGEVCAALSGPSFSGECLAVTACDPVAQSGCSAGMACYLLPLFGSTTVGCFAATPPASAVAENAPCNSGGCAAGLSCYPDDPNAGPSHGGHCRRFCDPRSATNGCAMETPRCTALSVTGAANPVGICVAM